jgi:hypothetical protein
MRPVSSDLSQVGVGGADGARDAGPQFGLSDLASNRVLCSPGKHNLLPDAGVVPNQFMKQLERGVGGEDDRVEVAVVLASNRQSASEGGTTTPHPDRRPVDASDLVHPARPQSSGRGTEQTGRRHAAPGHLTRIAIELSQPGQLLTAFEDLRKSAQLPPASSSSSARGEVDAEELTLGSNVEAVAAKGIPESLPELGRRGDASELLGGNGLFRPSVMKMMMRRVTQWCRKATASRRPVVITMPSSM